MNTASETNNNKTMIWKNQPDLASVNAFAKGTAMEHLGIEVTEIGPDYITARMPVDHRTRQPMGILHGGASVLLAESLGSFASVLCLDDMNKQSAVGVEINANHLRSVREGFVFGTARPIRVGRTIQVWNIEIVDEAGRMVCVSRLTIAVVERL
jgi:1,4-dihydroxy-2-naphthoyl-CoA hydrolase